jgi:hypothetical protein
VLGLIVIGRGNTQETELITQVAVVTVTLSLLLYSLTAAIRIRLVQAGGLTGPVGRSAGPARNSP